MTKLVEVWTINNSPEYVPEGRTHLEMFEWNYGRLPSAYVTDNKFFDEIKMVALPIINLRECKGSLDKFGKPDYKVSDRYIAIHPELEEIVAVKYKAINITNAERHIKETGKLLNVIAGYESSLNNFKGYPWWKRIWLAFKGDIS